MSTATSGLQFVHVAILPGKYHAFDEKLGCKEIGSEAKQNWLILRNGESTIGLFHDMFDKNA